MSDLRRAAVEAKRLWHQASTTARRNLGDYRDGKISAADVEQTFAMLTHATRVLAQCSDALVAVPYATEAELEAAVAEEQDRLHPTLPAFVALCGELLQASQEWRDSHALYEDNRPKNRVARRLRVPPVDMRRHKGKLGIDIQFRPEQEPLAGSTEMHLRGLAEAEASGPPALLVEVEAGGKVLLGPAQSGE